MCGRYTLVSPLDTMRGHFGFSDRPNIVPRWNVAPTDIMPIVRQEEQARVLTMMRWGLVPRSAHKISVGSKAINIRAERIVTNQSYTEVLRSRRCLVPVDGFYEWQKHKGYSQPYLVTSADKQLIALAGIWEEWVRPFDVHKGSSRDLGLKGEVVKSYAILTIRANKTIKHIHDRMPVIIDPPFFEAWLDNSKMASNGDTYLAELINSSSQKLTYYPVGNTVNNVINDDSRCIKRVPSANHRMVDQCDLFE